MNKVQSNLINILNSALNNTKMKIDAMTTQEENMFFKLAVKHQIHFIIYNHLEKSNDTTFNSLYMKQIKDLWKINMIKSTLFFSKIPDILNICKDKGIDVMVVKGYYFKNLYDNPFSRTMKDIDIFVTPDDFEETYNIIKKFGYTDEHDGKTVSHHTNFHRNTSIPIELHNSLVKKRSVHQYGNFNEYIWNNSKSVSINSANFTVPSIEDHALYACIHMLGHYKTKGFGLRQLSDFIVLVNKNIAKFNWDYFLETSKKFKVYNFVTSIITITYNNLGLNLPNKYLYLINNQDIHTNLLFEKIFSSGVFGESNGSTIAVVNSKKANPDSKFYKLNNKIQVLFPKKENLGLRYEYIEKIPILLPVAWIHRFFYFIIRKDIKRSKKLPDFNYINKHIKEVKWYEKR